MKRVLIITYYWPPSGGSGVQRWLKFVKYLPQFGWQPIIYTPENPAYDIQDTSLLQDIPKEAIILKRPIWEPYKYAALFNNKKKGNTLFSGKGTQKRSFTSKALSWIRGNCFIPDPRVYWVNPSFKYLSAYLKENPVDAIVSTGPPHSMHLIAQKIKKAFGIPWIADFRDPFAQLDIYEESFLMKRSKEKVAQLERNILNECDVLLSTCFTLPDLLEDFDENKMAIITNGYDLPDFEHAPTLQKSSDKFIIFHAGIMNDVRNPVALWEVLKKWKKEKPRLFERIEVHLAGIVSDNIKREVASKDHLRDKVKLLGYLDHNKVIDHYHSSSLLLLAIYNSKVSKVNIPGKIFEYFGAKKYILAYGSPDSDVARLIRETNTGYCILYEDVEQTERILLDFILNPKRFSLNSEKIQRYSRQKLTKELSKLLNKYVENSSPTLTFKND